MGHEGITARRLLHKANLDLCDATVMGQGSLRLCLTSSIRY